MSENKKIVNPVKLPGDQELSDADIIPSTSWDEDSGSIEFGSDNSSDATSSPPTNPQPKIKDKSS